MDFDVPVARHVARMSRVARRAADCRITRYRFARQRDIKKMSRAAVGQARKTHQSQSNVPHCVASVPAPLHEPARGG
jgi:hypothetical protein